MRLRFARLGVGPVRRSFLWLVALALVLAGARLSADDRDPAAKPETPAAAKPAAMFLRAPPSA